MVKRRSGTTNNPIDTDIRLQQIDLELSRAALRNVGAPDSAVRAQAIGPSLITGLRLDAQVIGGISISWSAVQDLSLLYYEVQVSTTSNFIPSVTTTFKVVSSTTFLYQRGNPNSTYYFRVRAISDNSEPGVWSPTINSKTGQAVTENLATGAAAGYVRGVQTWDPEHLIATGTSYEFGHISSKTKGGPVLLLATIQLRFTATAGTGTSLVQIFEDGVEIESFDYANLGANDASARGGLPGLSIPSVPPAGDHTYHFKISPTNASVWLTRIRRAVVELRTA